MHAFLLLAANLTGQFFVPAPLPYVDPMGYQLAYDGFGVIVGPFAPPVGSPKTIDLPAPPLTGRVVSMDLKSQTFLVDLPGERVKVHYGATTRWLGRGQLAVGRTVRIDAGNRTVTLD